MNNKLVSIVCPTYNCERFVKKTISSVLNQKYENFELLIIDDCSSDKTVDIVKSIKDKRIKLFVNNKNSGAAYSRNKALALAKGDYIAFLDGDDLWAEDKLEKQIAFMEKNNVMFSYTDYELIDEHDQSLGVYYTGPRKVTYRKFLHIDYVGTSTVVYKREIYPDLKIPDDIFKRNDDALWLLLSKKETCFRMPGIYSKYRRVSGSISSGKKSKLFHYHVVLYQKLYGASKFKATIYALRNVFYYFCKQILYKKRIRNSEDLNG